MVDKVEQDSGLGAFVTGRHATSLNFVYNENPLAAPAESLLDENGFPRLTSQTGETDVQSLISLENT